jgi:formylglycine-generating enzyme required for sulfatase activity
MNVGFPPEAYPRMPVDRVSWVDARRELGRGALVLPTEARWEYSCRAGTESGWSWGSDGMLYAKYANLGDRSYHQKFENAHEFMIAEDDGFTSIAPVGSLLPNAFGLHDMHGNLHEWCVDDLGPYSGGTRTGDGKLLASDGYNKKIARGACYNNTIWEAASWMRFAWAADRSEIYCGVRAARDLQP